MDGVIKLPQMALTAEELAENMRLFARKYKEEFADTLFDMVTFIPVTNGSWSVHLNDQDEEDEE